MLKATTTRGQIGGKLQRLWKGLSVLVLVVAFLAASALAAGALGACSSPPPGTIGAQLGKRTDGRVFVRGVPPGQGADKAGLMVDDEIIAIEGRAVTEMSQEDIKKAVRGDKGSSFTLTIERDGRRRDVKVERSPLLPEAPEKR